MLLGQVLGQSVFLALETGPQRERDPALLDGAFSLKGLHALNALNGLNASPTNAMKHTTHSEPDPPDHLGSGGSQKIQIFFENF